MVVDNSGPASFVLFDKEVIQFIRKTASELKEALIRVSMLFLLYHILYITNELIIDLSKISSLRMMMNLDSLQS